MGLIKMAQKNLESARQCASVANNEDAMEAAIRSTENISRALMHCFGEKPELGSGQEEPLRLLARRFIGTEHSDFLKIIEEISQLSRSRTLNRQLARLNIDGTLNYVKAKLTEQMVESASLIFTKFCRIMEDKFASEIPELREVCPKCRALDVSVMAFSETSAKYTCTQCRHSWNAPRNP
jgi:hypothetical protein